MGFNGNLLIEAGLFDPDHIRDSAQLAHSVGTHDDAELRRVVEHDGKVGVVGQQPDVFNYLVLGFGCHVGRRDDQQVEALAFCMLGQRDRLVNVGVGYVSADGPTAFSSFGNGVHHLDPLVVG